MSSNTQSIGGVQGDGASLRDQALAVPAEPARGLVPLGFDPSRVIVKISRGLGWVELRWPQLRAGFEAMKPGKGIDYFEAWDVASALLPAMKRRGLNSSYVADRIMQRARKAGWIRHRGRGQWVRCDSDRSGEAGETGTGSTVGDSAGPKDIAHD